MTAQRMGTFKVIARSPERFRDDVAICFIGDEIKMFSFHNAPACLLLKLYCILTILPSVTGAIVFLSFMYSMTTSLSHLLESL